MIIDRRGFLAGVASVAATRGARASPDVDIVVIGAGAAGLAAAKQIRAAGQSFVVLEARARIGGRALTDASLGAPFDAGAQFIHWAERNPWRRIAADLGVPLQDRDLEAAPGQLQGGGQAPHASPDDDHSHPGHERLFPESGAPKSPADRRASPVRPVSGNEARTEPARPAWLRSDAPSVGTEGGPVQRVRRGHGCPPTTHSKFFCVGDVSMSR